MSASAPGAYAGVTVLELGQVYLGPYCGLLMSRLGADVIKIEPPAGEPLRRYGTPSGDETAAFSLLNAGKRGVRLDLKTSAGRDIFLRLVEVSDVVIENFAPDTLERLGIGYEELSARNPRIVLASGRGYGPDGPYRDLLAMDLMIQAVSGVLATTGFPDGPPVKAGPAIADFSGGVHLMAAIGAALYQRTVTGQGAHVQVAMHDCVVPMLSSALATWFDGGAAQVERTGNRHSGLSVAPYNVYQAKDGWVAINALTDRHWQSLCDAMGRPDLGADPSLATNPQRAERIDEIDEIVTAWTANATRETVVETLAAAQVPVAPVLDLAEVVDDPQVRAQSMLQEVDGEPGSKRLAFGSPLRLSTSPRPHVAPAPELGAHSQEVLSGKLGLAADELGELARAGVI